MVRPIWKPEDKGTQVMQSKKGMSILGLKWCKEGLRMDLREEHKKTKQNCPPGVAFYVNKLL